jgi:hypothetical protein
MAAEYVVAFRPAGDAPAGEKPKLAKTRTIGLGGALFETDEPLERGQDLMLELVVGGRTLTVAARVVYVERVESGGWGNGVQFLDITEEDREFLLACYLEREYRITPE